MPLPKQRSNESDADYAARLKKYKEAKREYARQYVAANRDVINEKRRKHYEANKEAANRANRAYREANKEALEGRRKAYYEANKEAKQEYARQYRKANKEAIRERSRQYREANREVLRERNRRYRDAKTLKWAKGKPLRSDFRRATRPKRLTELLLQEAENRCLLLGLDVDQKFDTVVLCLAAEVIRGNPFYPVVVPEEEMMTYYNEHGITNPWYGTDYLHESAISQRHWAKSIRQQWRNRD